MQTRSAFFFGGGGFFNHLSPEGRTGRLSRDACTELLFLTAQNPKTAHSIPDVSLASVFSPDMALSSIVIRSNDSDKKCTDLVMRSRETLDSLTTTNGLSFVISVLNMPKCC
jgi:hypothetical protein